MDDADEIGTMTLPDPPTKAEVLHGLFYFDSLKGTPDNPLYSTDLRLVGLEVDIWDKNVGPISVTKKGSGEPAYLLELSGEKAAGERSIASIAPWSEVEAWWGYGRKKNPSWPFPKKKSHPGLLYKAWRKGDRGIFLPTHGGTVTERLRGLEFEVIERLPYTKRHPRSDGPLYSIAIDLEQAPPMGPQKNILHVTLEEMVPLTRRPNPSWPFPKLTPAEKFFISMTGYTEGDFPKAVKTGKALAVAEKEARDRGWNVIWNHEEGAWEDFVDFESMTPEEREEWDSKDHEVLWARVVDEEGQDLGSSLGGVVDPDRAYIRLIEAELFREALDAKK